MIDTHPEIPTEVKVHAMVSAPLDDMRKYLKLPADMTDKEVENLQTWLLMPKEERETAKKRRQAAKAVVDREEDTQTVVSASTKRAKSANSQSRSNAEQATTNAGSNASKPVGHQPGYTTGAHRAASNEERERDFIGVVSRPAPFAPSAANTQVEATASIQTEETATIPAGGNPVRPIARMRSSSSLNKTATRAGLKVPEPMSEEEFNQFSEEQETRKKRVAKIYQEERAKILEIRPDGSVRRGPIPLELAAATDAIFARALSEVYR